MKIKHTLPELHAIWTAVTAGAVVTTYFTAVAFAPEESTGVPLSQTTSSAPSVVNPESIEEVLSRAADSIELQRMASALLSIHESPESKAQAAALVPKSPEVINAELLEMAAILQPGEPAIFAESKLDPEAAARVARALKSFQQPEAYNEEVRKSLSAYETEQAQAALTALLKAAQ
jgi:hypothetical protein